LNGITVKLLRFYKHDWQFHFDSEVKKAAVQVGLALGQRQASDSAGAIATAEQARNRPEQFYRDQPDNASIAQRLSVIYAVLGNKESLGENSRAISTLARLLKTPYCSVYGPAPVTPALLRLDLVWEVLRAAPAFQKLCEEKQP